MLSNAVLFRNVTCNADSGLLICKEVMTVLTETVERTYQLYILTNIANLHNQESHIYFGIPKTPVTTL